MFGKVRRGNFLPPALQLGVGGLGAKQVKEVILAHAREEFLGEMFFIGQEEGFIFGAGSRPRISAARCSSWGLACVTDWAAELSVKQRGWPVWQSKKKKVCAILAGLCSGVEAMATHLALAIAEDAVRIQGQERTGEMVAGTTQFAQSDLELLGLRDGVSGNNSWMAIGGTKGKPLANSKPFWESVRRWR